MAITEFGRANRELRLKQDVQTKRSLNLFSLLQEELNHPDFLIALRGCRAHLHSVVARVGTSGAEVRRCSGACDQGCESAEAERAGTVGSSVFVRL